MKKYLCLISFAMVFLFGLSAFAEENEDYVVLSYDMTTRNVITENRKAAFFSESGFSLSPFQ